MLFHTFSPLLLHSLCLFSFTLIVNALYIPNDAPYSDRSVQLQITSPFSRRSVWAPKILSPDNTTKWMIGSNVTVSWDTHDKPKDITNPKGEIFLGYSNGDDGNEHLDTDHPLASGFDLSSGSTSLQVPNVEPGGNYIIVLFGDSGNRSPQFEISYITI